MCTITDDPYQLNQLIHGFSDYLKQIGLQNNKVSIGITLEAIIDQNQFILSLWQTYLTAHFAIIAGLFSYNKPLNKQLLLCLAGAYSIGVIVNGISLYDAYQALEAMQNDIYQSLSEMSTEQNLHIHLRRTRNYFRETIGFSYYRAVEIPFIYIITWLSTLYGLYMHKEFHGKAIKTQKHNFNQKMKWRRHVHK